MAYLLHRSRIRRLWVLHFTYQLSTLRRSFSEITGAVVLGKDKSMSSCTHEEITMINFGMGSPNAATVMDLLGAINPNAVLFLGKCGGLKNAIRLVILFYQLAPFEEKEHLMTISHQKYLQCPHLPCKKRFPPRLGITGLTTGQELFIPRTAGFGNLMVSLKST